MEVMKAVDLILAYFKLQNKKTYHMYEAGMVDQTWKETGIQNFEKSCLEMH